MRISGSSEPVILADWMISGKLAKSAADAIYFAVLGETFAYSRFGQIVRRKGRKELAKLSKGVLFIIKLHKVPKIF